jgi:hypothetical protein
MRENLNNFVSEFKLELDNILGDYKEYEFNSSQLPEVLEYTHDKDIRKHPEFTDMFEAMRAIKLSCLYWFSVNTVEEAKQLKDLIADKKIALWSEDKTKCRILPAINKNDNSTVIYVGVRKGSNAKTQQITNIAGRMVQHLGYYREGRTQGLQLAYFARELNIDFKLHFYSLHNCPDEYLYILEKIFAKKLKPICGAH